VVLLIGDSQNRDSELRHRWSEDLSEIARDAIADDAIPRPILAARPNIAVQHAMSDRRGYTLVYRDLVSEDGSVGSISSTRPKFWLGPGNPEYDHE